MSLSEDDRPDQGQRGSAGAPVTFVGVGVGVGRGGDGRIARTGRTQSGLSSLAGRLRGADRQRLVRYGLTSLLALGVSEAVLLVLSATTGLSAMAGALAANLAGTVPSYLLSRYWIWPEADRDRAGRQVVLYWATSLVSMAISSVTLELVADHLPGAHLVHLALLGAAYLVISLVLWVGKYVSYRTLIFT